MILKLKEHLKRKNVIILLAALAMLFGTFCSSIGILAIPFVSAYSAALFVFTYPKKYAVLLYIGISSAICTFSAYFGEAALLCAIISVSLGLSISLAFVFGRSKAEAVVMSNVLLLALSVIFLLIAAVAKLGSFDFGSIRLFYSNAFSEWRTEFISYFEEAYLDTGAITHERFSETIARLDVYFENLLLLLPSLLVIISLVITGIAFKVFTAVIGKFSAESSHILGWRFSVTNVFAVFYVTLAVFNMFTIDISLFTIVVINLYSIFNFIFAYIGYNFIAALIAHKTSPVLAHIILISAVLLLQSFALNILAIGGVVFTFALNAARKKMDNLKNHNNESEGDNEKH